MKRFCKLLIELELMELVFLPERSPVGFSNGKDSAIGQSNRRTAALANLLQIDHKGLMDTEEAVRVGVQYALEIAQDNQWILSCDKHP